MTKFVVFIAVFLLAATAFAQPTRPVKKERPAVEKCQKQECPKAQRQCEKGDKECPRAETKKRSPRGPQMRGHHRHGPKGPHMMRRGPRGPQMRGHHRHGPKGPHMMRRGPRGPQMRGHGPKSKAA